MLFYVVYLALNLLNKAFFTKNKLKVNIFLLVFHQLFLYLHLGITIVLAFASTYIYLEINTEKR